VVWVNDDWLLLLYNKILHCHCSPPPPTAAAAATTGHDTDDCYVERRM
jgi:hypothetical protein